MPTTLLLMSLLAGVTGTHLLDGEAALAPEGPLLPPGTATVDVTPAPGSSPEFTLAHDLQRAGANEQELRLMCETARTITRGCAYFEAPTELPPTELHTQLAWDRAGYFGFGLAPAATLQTAAYGGGSGFNPALRYDAEFGWAWRRPDGRRELRVGVHPQLTQYFGRVRPGGGADVVVRGSVGHVYLRGGLGAVGGLPRSRDVEDALPAIGGTIGLGVQGRRDEVYGRIGVDYDLRVNTNFEAVHTVLLVARLEFAWF